MRLYLIRHGESENNLKKCWTGWYDAPLTDKGRADALDAARILEGVHFDKVYASDLSRAIETAQIALPGCDVETTPLLREVCLGSLENQPTTEPTGEARAQMNREGYAAFGGETFTQFSQRLTEFLEQLDGNCNETVAAFCHGGCLRTLLRIIMGQPMPQNKILCNNCAVAVFEFVDGSWMLHSWINTVNRNAGLHF